MTRMKRDMKEVVALRKKQAKSSLGPLEKRRLKKLTKRVDAGLRQTVRDIRSEDP